MRLTALVPSAQPARSGVTTQVANFIVTSWRKYRQQRRLRATMHILHKLDNRSLKDIGLDRSEIESAVLGLSGRPSQRYIELRGSGIIPRG